MIGLLMRDAGILGAITTAVAPIALAACSMAPPARETAQRAPVVAGWPAIPARTKFGQVSAVDVDSHGHVFVLHRAGRKWAEPFPAEAIAPPTVFMFRADGTLLARWGAGRFIMPHGLSVDAEDRIWIADVGREQVFRFSHEGSQQLELGERGIGAQDSRHFGRPADIAFLGDRVLIADGYVNTRVAVFDQAGRFRGQFGDFRIAHAVAVDDSRIFVADRERAEIGIFAHDGKPLDRWVSPTGSHTYSLAALGEGRLLAVEGRDKADRTGAIVRVYAADGRIETSYDAGLSGGGASLGHDIAVGPDGFAYLADVYGDRVVRFRLPATAKER